MKIAIIGTRGIPARYGGFETCAEKISEYLAKKGHKILVTCRKYLYPDRPVFDENIRLIYLPSIKGKITDTFSHTFFSILAVLMCSPDVVLIFNSANSPLAMVLKLYGKKIVINVDGMEWKRRKWGIAGRLYFKFASLLSTVVADKIVADSQEIARYYQSVFHCESTYIPYGADIIVSKEPEVLLEFGLKEKTFFFNGSRLEPENNQDLIVREFKKARTNKDLVIAGDVKRKNRYVKKLLAEKNGNIHFVGTIFQKEKYVQLQANSIAYIHGNEVGGTNPALLSAMGCGACILALDVPFNREVLDDCGLYFTKQEGSLANLIEQVSSNPEKFSFLGEKARERAKRFYQWEDVAKEYEKLFLSLKNER